LDLVGDIETFADGELKLDLVWPGRFHDPTGLFRIAG
jgi:hypothetical protein